MDGIDPRLRKIQIPSHFRYYRSSACTGIKRGPICLFIGSFRSLVSVSVSEMLRKSFVPGLLVVIMVIAATVAGRFKNFTAHLRHGVSECNGVARILILRKGGLTEIYGV